MSENKTPKWLTQYNTWTAQEKLELAEQHWKHVLQIVDKLKTEEYGKVAAMILNAREEKNNWNKVLSILASKELDSRG